MSVKEIQERNQALAAQINKEARADPDSPYRDKFVGLANGQVVVVTDDLDELARRLCEVEPDTRKTFCIDASQDYDEVHRV